MSTEGLIKIWKEENQLMTDSLNVAKVFKKRHERVLDKIDNLQCSQEFKQHNFVLCDYQRSDGDINRKYKKYKISRDGWSFLVMGFGGKRAAKFKEDYIALF